MEPLSIGILGAARIAEDGIVSPAAVLGHRVTAVAARNRDRAERFAARYRVPRVHDGYAELLADPDVDVVYNALVNSEHTVWNLAAVRAGKHVLSEKPMSCNAEQARAIRTAAAAAGVTVVEGLHHLHHPVNLELRRLVVAGELGDIERVDVVLHTPSPPDDDPRWSLALAGGATMDLGCYALSAARHFGTWIGGPPELGAVSAELRAPELDAAVSVSFDCAGVAGSASWSMCAPQRIMTWTVAGSRGTATSPAFAVPHNDNRLVLDLDGRRTVARHGNQTSYTYQLASLARTLREGAPFLVDIDDAVANAEFIDRVLRSAGLSPRG